RSRYEYDANGNLTYKWALLSGTADLQRSHESGRDYAPLPETRSHDGEVLLSTITYRGDGTGLPKRAEGPNGSCTDTDYDGLFTHLPTSAATYVHGCGSDAVVSAQAWNRGRGAVTLKTDSNGST